MGNHIALFKNYTTLLDEKYKLSSLTSVLDSDNTIVSAGANANEIIIQKLDMQGLGDYSRTDGYAGGDVTLTNETKQFNYERGRIFLVDNMDNEETAGMAYGRLAGEFIRTKVAPEVDAVRLSTYAGIEGIQTTTAATLSTFENIQGALITATNALDEAEVYQDGRILFITPTLLTLFESGDLTKSKAILDGFQAVVKVPQSRFYTAVDLLSGKNDETAGGYARHTGANNINFMIIQKDAVLQITKHADAKVITPEMNQTADAWKFGYRIYGLNDVQDNKKSGIYLHKSAVTQIAP